MMIAAAAVVACLMPQNTQDPDYEKLLGAAKLTLSESVDLAMKEAKEGTPLVALLGEGVRGQRFTVFFSRGDKTYGYSLRSSDGKLDSTARMSADDSALAAAMKIKLTDAIGAALKAQKGQAVEARCSLNAAKKPEGVVRIYDEGKIRTATVDGESGKVTGIKDGK